jgi:hypothetical protein
LVEPAPATDASRGRTKSSIASPLGRSDCAEHLCDRTDDPNIRADPLSVLSPPVLRVSMVRSSGLKR